MYPLTNCVIIASNMLSIRLRCFDDVANKFSHISVREILYFIIYFITPTESVEGH